MGGMGGMAKGSPLPSIQVDLGTTFQFARIAEYGQRYI